MQKFLSGLGPVTAVIGTQWGDEGKGKVTDIIAEKYDVIARACGGANAGHTIVVNGEKHVFHLLPSGCLHDDKMFVLGSGMVIHLPTLLEEIETLKGMGIDIINRLFVSSESHILFEYHKDIDATLEKRRSERMGQGLGTTKRGIGPAYMEKSGRAGIRMEQFGNDLTAELELKSADVKKMFDVDIDVSREMDQLQKAHSVLEGRVVDTVTQLGDWVAEGKKILIEGAQGALLDLDHGTYPYVTSSSTTICGALQGLGMPPQTVISCIGVAKAYCTRVGSGAFPTEAEKERANRLRERGGEFGATTGRPRRCGWLCIPDLKRAHLLNGFSHWNITKLDVLDEEDTIPVGVRDTDGDGIIEFTELSGWKTSTKGITKYEDLPENARGYIEFIEKETGVPVGLIGTGPGREEMIVKSK